MKKKTQKYFLKPFSGLKGKSFGGKLEIQRRGTDLVASGTVRSGAGETMTGNVTLVARTSVVVVSLSAAQERTDEVCLELPIQLNAAEDLQPFAQRERPWNCWPEIDAFIRAAAQKLNVPDQVAKDIDHDLEILTAIHYTSAKHKPLPRLPRMNSRRRALVLCTENDLNSNLESRSYFIKRQFELKEVGAEQYLWTSNNLLAYLELLDEKNRRLGQSHLDRMQDLRDAWGKDGFLSSSVKSPFR